MPIVERFLNQHSLWIELFSQNPYRANSLLNKYSDKRFNGKQRLDNLIHHFQTMEQKFGKPFCQQLLTQKSLLLAQLNEGLTLNLNINQIDAFEGLFALKAVNFVEIFAVDFQ